MVFGEILSRTNYYTSYINGTIYRQVAKGMNFKGEGLIYKFEE